jgi:hypothetical protein
MALQHHHRSNIKPNKAYKKSGGHSSKSELRDAAKGPLFFLLMIAAAN